MGENPRLSLLPALAVGLALALAAAAAHPHTLQPRHEISWREAVAVAARDVVGAPYRFGGQTPRGFDCSGLVAYSYGQAGIRGLPRTAAGLYAQSRAVAVGDLRPGDLLFFSFGRARISHVAVYVGDGWFAHAQGRGGSVELVRLDHPYWRGQLAKAGRPLAAPARG